LKGICEKFADLKSKRLFLPDDVPEKQDLRVETEILKNLVSACP
jgi:hypothetical protein